MKLATAAIHAGQNPDPTTGATIPPIHVTTTYTQDEPGLDKGFDYSRAANPTRAALETCLTAIEGGAATCCFSSGCAATMAVFSTLSPGDCVAAYSDVYGGTYRILEKLFKPWGLSARYTDDPTPAGFAAITDSKTKLIWLESPSNPLLRVIDIRAIAEMAHEHDAKLVVDNTFATPALQRPLPMGADYVVHSSTKYLGGHSDVVGGAVIVADKADIEPIHFYLKSAGGCPGPFDCYLVHRGIKTLALRMKAHCESAAIIARQLTGHFKLEKVIYPGLDSHPDHAVASRQMCGGGGIVSIVLKGGRDAAFDFCRRVRVFACAESLGGVESLVNHPAIMTHASIPRNVREARGITDGLLRLSVGIEDVSDLIADIDQALE